MVICGLKLTHDGAVAIIENNKLIFCVEVEKLNNNLRHSEIFNVFVIENILKNNGYNVTDVDIFVIDGWGWGDNDPQKSIVLPRLKIRNNFNQILITNNDFQYYLNIAKYQEANSNINVLKCWQFNNLLIANKKFKYLSFFHTAGHVMSSYCTSSASRREESSYILTWDGGMFPNLCYYDCKNKKLENLGPIFLLIGNIYSIFSQYFGPFKTGANYADDDLSVPGKVMAYISQGSLNKKLYKHFNEIYYNYNSYPSGFANYFAHEFSKINIYYKYSDEDILASFHFYLEEMIIAKLRKKISLHNKKCQNICLAGGSFLNIKWNSAIRNSGLFSEVHVPPFPNDSGSAIGAACCAMYETAKLSTLEWNVFSGPKLIINNSYNGWKASSCDIAQLAQLLYTTKEPVIYLHGRAELGPRSLGHRSIIADATNFKIKNILNTIKNREEYRPISPVCLEEKANKYFIPGTKSQYMLFDYKVRNFWLDKIPAVVHFDNSARLQTISKKDDSNFYDLLLKYEKISKIPILCNTSANCKGSGFFPDVYSATKWGKTNYVWCDNIVYTKIVKIKFDV